MLPINLTFKDELKQFFIIALPLLVAYLAEFAMFLTTKMVVGKLGYHSLAAVGIAGDLSFEILIVLMALLSIVGVLAAQVREGVQHDRPQVALTGQPLDVLERVAERALARLRLLVQGPRHEHGDTHGKNRDDGTHELVTGLQ